MFNWNKWLEIILMSNGIMAFIGAIMYVEGLKYHKLAFESWGLAIWAFGALITQVYCTVYFIVNAAKIMTWIKVGAMSILAKFQPREK